MWLGRHARCPCCLVPDVRGARAQVALGSGKRCYNAQHTSYDASDARFSLRCDAVAAAQQPTQSLAGQAAVDSRAASEDEARAVAETLQLLEWPALCQQVACFASTSLAAREIARTGLRIGASQRESENLVQQTAEARRAPLQFGDIYNLHPVVAAAQESGFLTAQHLNAVAATLEAAASLQQQLGMPGPGSGPASTSGGFPCLWAVMQPAAAGAPDLVQDIRHCIGEDARVLDRSSETLAAARRRRRENLQELRVQSEVWARQMFAQKASENAQVMTQRGRLCVSVRAGRQGELPRGSVKLSASRTGATLYIEPAPLVTLNNAEASLAEEERFAQDEVLRQLAASVARHSKALLSVMKAVVELDIITARAQHAAWIGGVAPAFDDSRVHLPGARHPLLLQPALPPLPETPEYDDSEFATSFTGQIASPLGLATAEPVDVAPPARRDPPQPVDLCVPPGKTSVIVTGPNTGGKTASMKTLGLLVLMAKAGLFLPLETSGKEPTARLPWFDRVLADLGDSQDLTQNLSTFSGHVTRVKRITASVSPKSLVLLDELGSGTDPVEGGALAAVLLEWLLPRAGLVFCTSHHGELKELPAKDERFVSARVEFDAASLKPTYKLLWGEAGESQALAVAEGLGFDRDIVAQAHEIARTGNLGGQQEQRAGKMKNSLAEELEDARQAAAAVEQRRVAAEAALKDLQRQLGDMRAKLKEVQKQADDSVREAQTAAQQRTRKLLDGFSQGGLAFEAAAAQLEDVKTGAVEQRRAAGNLFAQKDEAEAQSYQPRPGETVRLLSMGGATGQVLKGAVNGNGKLSVRVGRLTVEVRLSDVAPAAKGNNQAQANSQQRKQKERNRSKPTGQQQAAKREVLKVQLPENTADLRGMRQAEATHALQRAIDDCPPDSVLFVIHGHGTGAIKSTVRQQLKKHTLVKKFYEEPESAGGCTVVEFK